MMKRKLVYRTVPHNGGLVFAEPKRAAFVARLHAAIQASQTWAEFRAAMPRREYARIVRAAFDDVGEPRPKGTDLFSGESVPGWSDGDYPPWLQLELGRLLPASVLNKFGKREDTWVNGSFWLIPEANLLGVCAALNTFGWELESAQDLLFY